MGINELIKSLNAVEGFDPDAFMEEVPPQDESGEPVRYMPVRNRVLWFRLKNENRGQILTEYKDIMNGILIKARVFIDGVEVANGTSFTTYDAAMNEGGVKGAETQAVGRALQFAGYGTVYIAEPEGDLAEMGVPVHTIPVVEPVKAEVPDVNEKKDVPSVDLEDAAELGGVYADPLANMPSLDGPALGTQPKKRGRPKKTVEEPKNDEVVTEAVTAEETEKTETVNESVKPAVTAKEPAIESAEAESFNDRVEEIVKTLDKSCVNTVLSWGPYAGKRVRDVYRLEPSEDKLTTLKRYAFPEVEHENVINEVAACRYFVYGCEAQNY